MKKTLGLAATLIATLLVLSFITGATGNASEEEINNLIETASTPEDHMKIAAFYEKEAEKFEKKARSHASMADSYKKRSKPMPGMVENCTKLSKKYTETAAEYRTMASEHTQMADEMKMQ